MLGGGLGATARWTLTAPVPTVSGGTDLVSDLVGLAIVNIFGCVLIGLIVDPTTRKMRSALRHSFWVTGVLGGFTSFSAFIALFSRVSDTGSPLHGYLYAAVTVFTCLAGYFVGFSVRRALGTHIQQEAPRS